MNGRRESVDLFVSGHEGYHTYRIPALVTTAKGTVLAFCEGRRHSPHDAGEIDLVLKRSADGGRTWGETQVVATEPKTTCGNPCPMVDGTTGAVVVLFCKNAADGPELKICEGKAFRTVWLTRSEDEGATWSTPREITQEVKRADWTWYATGPGHGIQLRNGRLVAPCDHMPAANYQWSDPFRSHLLLSDDHGVSWRIGAVTREADTNECMAVETAEGGVCLNCRNRTGPRGRAVCRSADGGETVSEFTWDDVLIGPACQASVLRYTWGDREGKSRILFANPGSFNRSRMTVRVSYDECRTWPAERVLHSGPSGYSDLCVMPDGGIGCLYETGDSYTYAYEYIVFSRFDLEWLTFGKDGLGRRGEATARAEN